MGDNEAIQRNKMLKDFMSYEAEKGGWVFLVTHDFEGWKLLYLSSDVASLFKAPYKQGPNNPELAVEGDEGGEVNLINLVRTQGLQHSDLTSVTRAIEIVDEELNELARKAR